MRNHSNVTKEVQGCGCPQMLTWEPILVLQSDVLVRWRKSTWGRQSHTIDAHATSLFDMTRRKLNSLITFEEKIDRHYCYICMYACISRLQVKNSTGKGDAIVVWIHGHIKVEQWNIATLLNCIEHLIATWSCSCTYLRGLPSNWSELTWELIKTGQIPYIASEQTQLFKWLSCWPYIWERIQELCTLPRFVCVMSLQRHVHRGFCFSCAAIWQ